MKTEKLSLCRCDFGKFKNPKTNKCEKIEKFTWTTVNRMEVSIVTFGARLLQICVPDRNGSCGDVLMGHGSLNELLSDEKINFGAVIGPISGKLRNGEFCIDGKNYRLKSFRKKNLRENIFSQVNWIPFVDGTDVVLSHVIDEASGFTGTVLAQVIFSVKANNTLTIKSTARSNQVTPIDMLSRLYFNLASHGAGEKELVNHHVTFNAKKVFVKNSDGVLERKPRDVEEAELDLRSLKQVGEVLGLSSVESIDCQFVVDKPEEAKNNLQFVSRVIHPATGRVLEVHSNQPTVNFSTCSELAVFEEPEDESVQKKSSLENLTLDYLKSKLTEREIEFFKCRVDSEAIKMKTGARISEECPKVIEETEEVVPDKPIKGKCGSIYSKNSGFCVSCQNYHNALYHQQDHPNIILRPGQVYENILVLKFGIHVYRKADTAIESSSPLFPITRHPIAGHFPLRHNYDRVNKFF